MAEYLTMTELRNYDVNGTSYDLAALTQAFELGTEPGRAPESIGEVKVGQIVLAWVMGARYRRGVVTKVGRTKVTVAYTTQGAMDTARQAEEYHTAKKTERAGEIIPVRVGNQAVALEFVRVLDTPAAQPVQEAEEAPADEDTTTTPEVEAWNAQNDEDAESERTGDQLPEIETEAAEELTLHSQDGKVDNMNNDTSTTAYFPGKAEGRSAADFLASLNEPETAPAQKHTGSTVVALIERVWDRIRADHPELPEVVVTTGSGEGVKWGHFRPESWKLAEAEGRLHEFFLASEALAKGATQVLQTTVHEAAHTLSKVRGIQDTSRQGRWHNAEFKKAAEELGLEHKGSKADKSHGFSFVTLTTETKEKYADLLVELEKELKLTGLLPLWMGGTDEEDEQGGEKITGKPKKTEGEEGTKKSGNLKAVCECPEPVIVRLSQKVLDMGVVKCTDCDELFRAA
jgi:hypothetical protein